MSFSGPAPESGTDVLVQYRSHGDAFPARIEGDSITFDDAVEAVATGQSAAIYAADDPEVLLGGGVIASVVAQYAGV